MNIIQLNDEMLRDVVGGGGDGVGAIPRPGTLSPYEDVVVSNEHIYVALDQTAGFRRMPAFTGETTLLAENAKALVIRLG